MLHLRFAFENGEYSLKLNISSVYNVAFVLYILKKGDIPLKIISKYYIYKYFL